MAYTNGVVSVGTSPTLICTPGLSGVTVQNLSATAVTLGGPSVATGAGITLAANMTAPLAIPTGATRGTVGANEGLYGRVASSTANVAFATAG